MSNLHHLPRAARLTFGDQLIVVIRDPRETVLHGSMSLAQRLAIALCCTIVAIDGYDLVAITFAMPGIGAEWGTSKAVLGALFSAGIVGMAGGCLILGPMADSVGRRPMAITSLVLMTLGMILSAVAPTISLLMVWRLCTGVGIGAAVSVAYPLSVEYSSLRGRPATLAMVVISFPLGGAVGGIFATNLISIWGWRAAFLPGIVVPPLVILLCLRWLPEPLGLLIEKPRPSSLRRANSYLKAVGRPLVAALPPASNPGQGSVARVLGKEFRRVTGFLSTIYCLYSLPAYFILAWLPQIVVDRGFSPSVAGTVSVAASAGGVLGAWITGFAIRRFGLIKVLMTLLLGMGVVAGLIGVAPAAIDVLRALGIVAGIFVFGPIVGLMLLTAENYPVEVRSSGMGFIVGFSRWVAAVGPLIGGILFSSKLGVAGSCVLMGFVAVLSAGFLAWFHAASQPRHGVGLASARIV